MGTLNVEFEGACTHFLKDVPVPHRTVLVNASSIHFGHTRWAASRIDYVLLPHVGFVWTKDRDGNVRRLEACGAIKEGVIYDGVHMEVANAVGDLKYEPCFREEIPHLLEYADSYQPSADVVLNGRAACYFDISAGTVAVKECKGTARHAKVAIRTDGDPIVRVTPFVKNGRGPQEITLESGSTLSVGNRDLRLRKDDEAPVATLTSYDFLLHFLTCAQGIPQTLKKEPYGYDAAAARRAREDSSVLSEPIGELLKSGWESAIDWLRKFWPAMDNQASCSDSQYP